ncbi:hypothetical protein ACS0TY_005702 [Phlomoides rotata]
MAPVTLQLVFAGIFASRYVQTPGAVSFRISEQFFLQKLFVAMIMQLCGQRICPS